MRTQQYIASGLALVATLGVAACKRGETPAPQIQTTSAQPSAQPVTVTGCLRSGMFADSTWVLNSPSSGSAAGGTPVTYQLIGGDSAVLQQNAGRKVEVSGTVETEQRTASSSGKIPEHRAAGTSGTPSVE